MNILNNSAFSRIYSEYYKRVFTFLYNMCRDYHLAEELTQETFFQAFRSFGQYRGDSDIFTWLAAVAKHTYYKYMRKNKFTVESIDVQMIADLYERSEHFDSPEDSYIKKELRAAAERMVKKLPQKYRDVVILRAYAELSFAETAKILKISENSAKVIYFRAKKMLKEELGNEYSV